MIERKFYDIKMFSVVIHLKNFSKRLRQFCMSLKINDSTLGPRTEIFQKDYNLLLPIFRGAILISFELYMQLRNFSKSCLSGTFKQMFLFS